MSDFDPAGAHTENKNFTFSQKEFQELELPPLLKEKGVEKIVRVFQEKDPRITMTFTHEAKGRAAGNALLFAVDNKRFTKTIETFDKQAKAMGLDNSLVDDLRTFLLKREKDITGHQSEEAKKYFAELEKEQQVLKDKDPISMSIGEAIRTDNEGAIIMISGRILEATPVYQIINKARWKCNNCNNFTERVVTNPVGAFIKELDECPHCESENLQERHEYKSVVEIGLQPLDFANYNNPLDILKVALFDKDTENVQTGESVRVIGEVKKLRNYRNKTQYHNVVYCAGINSDNRRRLTLTDKDKKKILKLRKKYKTYDEWERYLVSQFAPNAIGDDHAKVALLLANFGAPEVIERDKRKYGRINVLFIGPPGVNKTGLGLEAIQLRPNSNQVSGKGTTGKNLTGMILPSPSGAYLLHLGAIPMANGGICFINEADKLPPGDMDYTLDAQEEGEVHIRNYARPVKIPTSTTIVATANPAINEEWDNNQIIRREEIPFSSRVLNRFDVIVALRRRTTKKEYDNYADEKSRLNEEGVTFNYEELTKIIELGRLEIDKVTIGPAQRSILNEFWASVADTTVAKSLFNERTLNSVYKIAKGFARMYLSKTVDDAIANRTIIFMNKMLADFHSAVQNPKNPFLQAYDEIVKVIMGKKLEDAIELVNGAIFQANGKGGDAYAYLYDEKLTMRDSKKIQNLWKHLQDDPRIGVAQLKPIKVYWKGDSTTDHNIMTDGSACDPCDPCDQEKSTLSPEKKDDLVHNQPSHAQPDTTKQPTKNQSGVGISASHRSHRSHSKPEQGADNQPLASLAAAPAKEEVVEEDNKPKTEFETMKQRFRERINKEVFDGKNEANPPKEPKKTGSMFECGRCPIPRRFARLSDYRVHVANEHHMEWEDTRV